jgi:AcrR family transcriptional regulator
MAEPVPLDRRQRRRQETIEEILDVAATVMAEHGVAGLTLGEVARRMGMRTPSLYGYFDGKYALYDALFERGWRRLLDAMPDPWPARVPADPVADAHAAAEVFTRWAVENPAYAPLMFWRPVPGFTPSETAYAPAVEVTERGRAFLADLRERGLLRPDVDPGRALRTWTVVITGVITQQLSNAPGEPYSEGTFSSTVPDLVDMFLAHYGGPAAARPTEEESR